MRNLGLCVFALAVLTAFLGILLWKVYRLDLTIVVALTLGMAYYDFLRKQSG